VTPAPTPTPTPQPTPTPAPTPTVFPIAVVVRFDDARPSITPESLAAAENAGQLLIPCEVSGLTLGGVALAIPTVTKCLPADQIVAYIHKTAKTIALLPPGLVSPSVKVLPIGQADLFGSPTHRALPYPLTAQTSTAASWTAYDAGDVRTLISTGDTCPDRGVSLLAVTKKKGWSWVLAGGSVKYTSFHMDTEFTGPQGKGWPVPGLRRDKNGNLVSALIADNDISANDFECPMVANWTQHNGGKVFTIDPRVAQLLATRGGLKVVTLGSNHITDAGWAGVRETVKYLDAAGIAHTGAGENITAALAPAVVNVHGLKFAFVGWDDIHGSAAATASHPGAAPMSDTNVCNSIKAARAVADVVIAMPQWGWPEYHATITKDQMTQRALMYKCGADGILGSGTHWASWASILPGPNGMQFAIGSHGNFLFDQNWSQQTMEGVVVEVTFVGTKLAQFRLHPYVVVQGAQPNLTDPLGAGKYVLTRVWSVSDIR
jgi:poly-gamma-glutamate synthesis protein (capsule biosynthesis protein)